MSEIKHVWVKRLVREVPKVKYLDSWENLTKINLIFQDRRHFTKVIIVFFCSAAFDAGTWIDSKDPHFFQNRFIRSME